MSSVLFSVLLTATLVYSSPDSHGHLHHSAPLLELNETDVLKYHGPTLPSYWSIDIEHADPSISTHPNLILFHVVFSALAFFVALPMAIALRSLRHPSRALVILIFYCLSAIGWGAAALYSKLTPNMYQGSSHAFHGVLVLLFAFFISLFDVFLLVRRVLTFLRSGEKFVLKIFWATVVLDKGHTPSIGPEYTELILGNPDEIDGANPDLADKESGSSRQSEEGRASEAHHWHHRRHHSSSSASEQTLSPSGDDDDLYPLRQNKPSLLSRFGTGILATLERALVFAAWAVVLTGIVTYTGICRQNFINGCLAHLIKGSIFWCYGLVTFARFLGSFADIGWAWNRPLTARYPSAEFVESLVIFTYGITNTWMERFGAHPGDPYTTRQIQHISIALMFWFAGLVGMGLESKRIRSWLAFPGPSSRPSGPPAEPPAYGSNFNPFPALVIGVTGAAMSAHSQTYLFQVQIHALWGFLLVGFAVLRFVTYFLLWVSPPRSSAPSRPPTEALASFFLACGGLVFILSTEEITFAAMRRDRDDVMMFLNVAVAVTCFAFCWILSIVTFKAWLKSKAHGPIWYHP